LRKTIVTIVCLLALALTAVLFWPSARYDITQVHPRLRELSVPYQSVNTGYYGDGGSISITIVDRDGHRLKMALPVSSRGQTYPRLFLGATHTSEPGAVEVPFTKDTRRMLIAIVEEHLTANDSSDIALIQLRGSLRDYVHVCPIIVANLYKRLLK
jgi:hypothetical protein